MKGLFTFKIIPGLLVFILIFQWIFVFPFGGIRTAKAAVTVPVNTLLDPPSIKRTIDSTMQKTKEYVLDGLALSLAQQMIRNITADIVDWINNDFEGGPAFLTDPAGFFTNVADEAIGDFIFGTDLGFLCAPFSLDIRLALGYSYQGFRKKARCTLTQIIDNSKNFNVNFDFQANYDVRYQYTWSDWYNLTTQPQNNPYGAYLLAEAEMRSRAAGAQQQQQNDLNMGRGFLSFKKCVEWETPSYDQALSEAEMTGTNINTSPRCLRYETKTPGSLVQEQLNEHLSGPLKQLEVADEINEIIAAMVGFVARKIMGGVGGLAGASQRQSGSSYSLTDNMRNLEDYYSQTNNVYSSYQSTYDYASNQVNNSTNGGTLDNGLIGNMNETNFARNGFAVQSSNLPNSTWGPNYGNDGLITNNNVAITNFDYNPWWQVDLGESKQIGAVKIYPRSDVPPGESLGTFRVFVSPDNFGSSFNPYSPSSSIYSSATINYVSGDKRAIVVQVGQAGRFVRVQRVDTDSQQGMYQRKKHQLQLLEVKVVDTESLTSGVEGNYGTLGITGSIKFTPEMTQPFSTTNSQSFLSSFSMKSTINLSGLSERVSLLRKQPDGNYSGVAFSSIFESLSVNVTRATDGNSLRTFGIVSSGGNYRDSSMAPFWNSFSMTNGVGLTTKYAGIVKRYVSYGDYELLTEILDGSGNIVGAQITDFTITDQAI